MVSVIFIHVMLAVLREYLAESTRENNRLAEVMNADVKGL
jgi:hypothetical protein